MIKNTATQQRLRLARCKKTASRLHQGRWPQSCLAASESEAGSTLLTLLKRHDSQPQKRAQRLHKRSLDGLTFFLKAKLAWCGLPQHGQLHKASLYSCCSAFKILFRHPPVASTLCNHISLGFSRGSPLRCRPHIGIHVYLCDHSLRSLYDNSLASSNGNKYQGVQHAASAE